MKYKYPSGGQSKVYCLVFLIISLFLFVRAGAQVNISGIVISHATKKGIPNASVFFNNATIGATTDSSGKFTLSGVKPGQYELMISVLGYSSLRQPLAVKNRSINLQRIELWPKAISLKEVRIVDFNAAWQRNLEWFRASFLGNTSLARDCEIINPEVLNMRYNAVRDSLTVTTDDFLIIKNHALGYQIKYQIDEFTRCDSGRRVHYEGPVQFEEMKGSEVQRKRWEKRRLEVYKGSTMHFLRSAIRNRLEQEGFRVFQYAIYANPNRPTDSVIAAKIRLFKNKSKPSRHRYQDSLAYWRKKRESPKLFHALLNFPLSADEIVGRTNQEGIFTLGCENDGLYIIYNAKRHFPFRGDLKFLTSPYNTGSTLVNFNSLFILFDENGWIINPEGMVVTGAWAKNRVAGLLPMDYTAKQ